MRCAQEVEDRNKGQGMRKENRIRDLSLRGVESAHLPPERRMLRRSLLFLERRARISRILTVLYVHKINAKTFIFSKF